MVNKLKKYLEPLLILTLSVLVFFMVYNLYLLQGTARVVNYTGLVRGATQRAVKLEIADMPNDLLLTKLDNIVDELQNSGTQYNLVQLDDARYMYDLKTLAAYWENLKQEIYTARQQGYTATKLLPMSEEYFQLADQLVSDAEVYSQQIAYRLKILEFFMIANVVALLIILVLYHLQSRRLRSKYENLSSTAYVDVQTGLANKSCCEKKLRKKHFLTPDVGFMMFDMNNLKQVNDKLGHAAGDSMILNFARLLRLSVPEHDFVGRFGGDEFIVILSKSKPQQMDEIIASLNEKIAQFNKDSSEITISYAVGKAHSSWYDEEVTMKILFEKADHNMYENKLKMKERRKQ